MIKSVLKYYLDQCDQAIIHKNELSFDFSDFYVNLSFSRISKTSSLSVDLDEDDPDEEFFSFNRVDDITVIDRLINYPVEFETYSLIGNEYLGWRPGSEEARSITNEKFYFLKKLKRFNEYAVTYDTIKFDHVDDGGYCNSEPNYRFELDLAEQLMEDVLFAEYVVSAIRSYTSPVPAYYNHFFYIDAKIKDSLTIPIISTNTKVRRIGYFKALGTFFDTYNKVPSTTLNKKFESFCIPFQSDLEQYKYSRGLIKETKNGISAKPYIAVAEELEIVTKINTIYHIGKPYKVYQQLKSAYSHAGNIFMLSDFDKLFFLETILRNDYFYFTNLLELLFSEEKMKYGELVNCFQMHLLHCLLDYRRWHPVAGRKVISAIDTIESRIKAWEKPSVYLEHIIMPRLHWMLDLGLINEKSGSFAITEAGTKLFQNLAVWNDLNTGKVVSPIGFLDRFMVHLFDHCYFGGIPNVLSETEITERIYDYINESFDLFKTLAPNRVTASQAVNYVKYKLYFTDHIKVGYQFIIGKLSEELQDTFIFKYQEQYQDGYIQKKR